MSRFERRAAWIWRQRGLHKLPFAGTEPPFAEEANRYVYFRKEITLAGAVASARVHASADGRYQLYVNEKRIGRGPARCSPAFQTVDPYDLTEHLRPGVNVIAALVHAYGRHTAWYELPRWEQARSFGCGGFFCQGDIVTEDEVIRLDTGPSWLYQEAQAWDRGIPGGGHGFTEIYDARLAPANWHGEIDGSPPRDWAPAEVLRAPARNFSADIVPFSNLVKRDIPAMIEGVRTPVNVVASGEVVAAPT